MALTAVDVADSVLLHATVLLALELPGIVSPLVATVGIHTHLRMREEASAQWESAFHQRFNRSFHEGSDETIFLDIPRHRCEEYSAAMSA